MSQIIEEAAGRMRLAQEEADAYRNRLHKAIRDAHEAGVPVTRLAKDAGVSRNTIYAILREKGTK